jgi:acetolactate synthase-1/3 small subunit
VVKVEDMTSGEHIERELLLIKLDVAGDKRAAFDDMISRKGARVIADRGGTVIVELTSSEVAVTRLILDLATVAEIREVVRSGALGISQGAGQNEGAGKA